VHRLLSADDLEQRATEQKTGLIVLIGPSSSGKSALAAAAFPDHMISMLSHHRYTLTGDQQRTDVTEDAERLENLLITLRLRRGEVTVVDDHHLQPARRAALVGLAARHNAPVSAVALTTPLAVCLDRNRRRPGYARASDATVISDHGLMTGTVLPALESEGFTAVFTYDSARR
jgi:predicted kinase